MRHERRNLRRVGAAVFLATCAACATVMTALGRRGGGVFSSGLAPSLGANDYEASARDSTVLWCINDDDGDGDGDGDGGDGDGGGDGNDDSKYVAQGRSVN